VLNEDEHLCVSPADGLKSSRHRLVTASSFDKPYAGPSCGWGDTIQFDHFGRRDFMARLGGAAIAQIDPYSPPLHLSAATSQRQ